MDRSFDLVQDAYQLREDIVRLEPTIIDLLEQVGKCAIFVRKYLEHGFIGTSENHNCKVHLFIYTLARAAKGAISDPIKQIEDFAQAFPRFLQALNSKVQIHTALVVNRIKSDTINTALVVNKVEADIFQLREFLSRIRKPLYVRFIHPLQVRILL